MGDNCPLCGFVIHPFMRRLQTVYTLSFAFFTSTLVYSILVYFLETRQVLRPAELPLPLPYALLVLAVLDMGLARRIGPPLEQIKTMQQLLKVFLLRLAVVEVIAVVGLALYMVSASIHWFVAFLAISWVGFLVVGSQMPRVAQRLSELAVQEAGPSANQ